MFSPRRCYAVANRHLRSHVRRYFYTFLGLTLGLFALEVGSFSTNGGLHSTLHHDDFFYDNVASSQWVAFFFVTFAFIALTFSHLRTKQSRIAYFMLPATNAEKFVAHLGLSVVFAIVSFAVAYVVGDLLRILLLLLAGGDTASVMPYFLHSLMHAGDSFLAPDGSVRWDLLSFIIGILLWNYSCHLLGSVVFRRWAFVKTIGVQLLIAYFFGLSVSATNSQFSLYIGTEHHQSLIKWVFIVANFLFAGLHTWLAYKLHNRLVVIPRRLSLKSLRLRRSANN